VNKLKTKDPAEAESFEKAYLSTFAVGKLSKAARLFASIYRRKPRRSISER
jgi:RNA polymerase-interacting CarD/CdnL/TRCF family regulator